MLGTIEFVQYKDRVFNNDDVNVYKEMTIFLDRKTSCFHFTSQNPRIFYDLL